MADEDIILNRDAFAYERMAGDFAVLSDRGVLLNFNKCSYFHVVADYAPVKINEFGKFDPHS